MSAARNLVFYGPPGTGKTYKVVREAVEIIDGIVDEKTVNTRYKQLLDAGRIWFVTFHPSYSYEDFIEGFRPIKTKVGRVVYDLEDGPFKLACDAASHVAEPPLFYIGERLKSGGAVMYEVIHVDSSGVAVKSENKKKNRLTPEVIQYAAFWTVEYLKSKGISPKDLSPSGQKNNLRKEVSEATGIASTVLNNAGPLRAVWESLEAKNAARGEDKPIVFIIDEINRADLSRVFGELMTLLEHDKRRGAKEERSVMLPYSKDKFTVPANISVLGTMNTADRSLAHMDVALRRRFEFIYVPPRPDLCPIKYGDLDISSLLCEWNRRISALLSADYLIGHAELLENKLEQLRISMRWNDTSDGQLRAFALTVRRKVLPLLLDYFHADWRQAAIVLGNNLNSEKEGLLKEVTYEDLEEKAGGHVSMKDFSTFEVHEWWDPESEKWDAKLFRSAMNDLQAK